MGVCFGGGEGCLLVNFFYVVAFFIFLFLFCLLACLFVGSFACLFVGVFAVCHLTYLCAKPFRIRVRSIDNKQKTKMNRK